MEKKMEKKLEVSLDYDPEKRTLECSAIYNGAKDGFVCMYDEYLTYETIQEFVRGFVQYLMEKENENNIES